jgi:hypothetical protein
MNKGQAQFHEKNVQDLRKKYFYKKYSNFTRIVVLYFGKTLQVHYYFPMIFLFIL